MTRFIFDFDHMHQGSPMLLKDLLGGKGANLAEMTSSLKLPVPPGFTISTEACHAWPSKEKSSELSVEFAASVARLEAVMKRKLGDPQGPLLVSVRSGAKFSMPGMMDTVLNLGLTDQSVRGLAVQTDDERFALDTYRRFISMYSSIVLGVDGALFEDAFEAIKDENGVKLDGSLSTDMLCGIVEIYKNIVLRNIGRPFPQDPAEQLNGAIEAVFRSWTSARAIAYREREGIGHELGTAVNVQAMVFGNRDENSGTGVGFTRNPATGERIPYGDFLSNAQGEDVVAGIRETQPLNAMREMFPEQYNQLLEIFDQLERHYTDMCDVEFTIEQGRLWMLQTRIGKRTGRAAIRMAVEMTSPQDIGISREEAILRVNEEHLEQVLHPQFATFDDEVLAIGLGASPGAAVGRCYFDPDRAVAAANRGENVLLVRSETSPDDVHGILAAQGVLTSRGGLVSHAAVIARGWGKPAVVGVSDLMIHSYYALLGGQRIDEGDWLSIDGTSGEIIVGMVPLVAAEPSRELSVLLEWADDIRRGHLKVRANADTGDDAAVARSLGAEGIGLCRTEHMFLGEARLPIVRRMILATTPEEERLALMELESVQRIDFKVILEAMDGLPVTVRLLDPPLHEFLPSVEELIVKEASSVLSDEESNLLAAARAWQETNPMLGTRGVRLGLVRPGLYEAQVRALMRAAIDRLAVGGDPIIEIMIPLTVSREELGNAVGWVDSAIASVVTPSERLRMKVKIGTMIETPRAALVADELASCAEFFSFGTNDLTQMTFGFSRDDVEGHLMDLYLEKGLISHNPFETIDAEGVGALIRTGVELGRKANASLTFGVCGEHGGDPASIALFADIGVDYVSCSPYRVPVARLAAAQAVMLRSTPKESRKSLASSK